MKMFLRKDHVKVEIGAASLPPDMQYLYPYHFNRKKTEYYFTLQKLPEILQVFKKDVEELPEYVRLEYYRIMNERTRVADLLKNGPIGDPKVSETFTLRPHQQLARSIGQVRSRFAFYFDTRTGKTPISIALIADDLKANPEHKWLVVAPLILLELAWEGDFKKLCPDIKVSICHASSKQARMNKINQKVNVYIINTESFCNYREYFTDIHGCIVDESSSMKSNKSKVSKELVSFSRELERFYLLSGTPAPNGEWEYYKQLQAVDYYGIQQSYAQFKQKYFFNTSRDVRFEKLVLRPDMKEELFDLIRHYSIYVDKEDVLDTPGRDFIPVEFKLPAELKEPYKTMRKELFIENENRTILAPSAAAKANKLNQISSGFIIDTDAMQRNKFEKTDEQEWYLLSDYRFRILKDLLAEQEDEQVIIWANYRKEFELIKAMLGNTCVQVYGATSSSDKIHNIKLFKEGKVRYLVANPASADKGLTLTNCHIAVYFSLNWSYELFKQSMERIYGDKSIQPKVCKYYIMMAKGTIDKVIYNEVLVGKRDSSQAVLDHLRVGDFDDEL